MDMDRLHAAGESTSEQIHELRNGKIKERPIAVRFEIGGRSATEIGLDHWPAEWPEMISARRRAVRVSE